nr:hypothetical protein [Tanacetum cinerariifolium]
MDMTIDQQVSLDEALFPHASRLRIGKSNFHLRSYITSKELTLQVVYDVLKLTTFYKAFLVIADVPEIYMQEFWVTATVHHHLIRFKMNNKKRIVSLEYFREMLHICPRIPNQPFDELPFEEEILAFLRNLDHNEEIKKITDEDFVYQVEHKDAKKSNEMYYPRFTKVIVNFFMTKYPSIPRRNKTSAKVDKPTKGKQPAKSSTAKDIDDQSDDESHDDQEDDDDQDDEDDDQTDSDNDGDDFVHPMFSTHDEEAKDEESFDPIVQTPSHVENSDDEGNDDASHGMNVGGNEGPNTEDDDNELYGDLNINLEGRDVQMTDVHTTQVLEDTHVTLTLVSPDGQQQSSSVSSQYVSNMLNLSPDAGIDSLFESTPRVDVPVTTTVEPLLLSTPSLPRPSIPIISQVQQAPAPSPVTAPSTSLQDLRNFGSLFGFDHRLKTLKAYFFEFIQTNQFSEAVFSIPDTVTLKRHRDDEDKDEEPSAGSDRGSKTRREGKEPKSATAPKEKASKTFGKDDDKLYKFKEGDLNWLRIQDIEDMLLLLVQGKLTNLTVEERFAFNVSLKMFTRSIVIQRRVEDLQLGDPYGFADRGEGTCFQLSQRFIACSYPTIKYKDIMKAQVNISRLPLLGYRTSFLKR